MEVNKRNDKDAERNRRKLFIFSVLKGERDQKNKHKPQSLLTGRKYLKYPLISFQLGTKKKRKIWSEIFRRSLTYHIDGASVPLISRKSYPSSNWKSVKTKAMVSPGSANMVQVQSALFSYSEGKCGLEIVPLVPRSVPPQAPSADKQNINY